MARGAWRPSLPSLAVARPVTTAMIFAGLCLLGLLSFERVPVQLMPDYVFPTLFVQAVQPGADPEQVERDLLVPLEGEISRIAGVAEITSTAALGQGSLQVKIHPNRDLEMAYLELQQRVQAASTSLPRGAMVFTRLMDTSQFSGFVMMLALRGDVDPDVLRRVAEQRLAPRLEAVDGVVQAVVTGGQGLSLAVEIDPEEAAARGVSPFQIRQAVIDANRREAHVGHVAEGGRRIFVSLAGRIDSPYELADLQVAPGPVLLRDVATVQLGLLQDERRYRVDGLNSVGLFVSKDETSNLLRVGNRLREALEELEPELESQGMRTAVNFDASEMVRDRIRDLVRLAAIGAVLALLVLLLFLRDLIAVAIIGLAIPVSVLVSGIGLALADLSIDVLTLMGMALAIGMLVDNAIVSFEAIDRRLGMGMPGKEAARLGGSEVQRAMLAATVSTCVVFAPLLWIESEYRSLWLDFAMSILIPLVASLMVALLLVPMLASILFSNRPTGAFEGRLDPARGWVTWLRALLAWGMRHPGLGALCLFIGALLTLIITLPSLALFFVADRPAADRIEAALEMPAGTTIDKTDHLARDLEGMLGEIVGVREVQTVVEEETAYFTVLLEEEGEATYREPRSVRREVVEAGRKMREGNLALDRTLRSSGSGGGGGGDDPGADPLGLGASLERVVLRGSDHRELLRLGREVQARLEQMDTVLPESISRDVFRSRAEELHVLPDRTALAMHGLSVQDLMNVVWSTRREVERLDVPVRWFGEDIDLALGVAGGEERALKDLEGLRLPTPEGGSVPLGEIARARIDRGPRQIQRRERGREISFTFRFRPDRVEGASQLEAARAEVEAMLASLPTPEGTTAYLDRDEPGIELKSTIYLAIFLLYLVLAITFESFLQPIVVMVTLPLAGIGVLWALTLTGSSVESMVLLAVVVLVGLVVNGAILLVDRAQALRREQGFPLARATLQATRDRTRAVLMTAGTTIVGLFPMALSSGNENEIWPPFAIATIGGMSFATPLTLLIIPVGFYVAGSLDELLARLGKLRALIATLVAAALLWLLYDPMGLVTSDLWRILWAPVVWICVLGIAWGLVRSRRRAAGTGRAHEGPRVVLRNATKVYGEPGPFGRALAARRLREARRAEEGRPLHTRASARRDLIWEIPLMAALVWLHFWMEHRFWLFVHTWITWWMVRRMLRDLGRTAGWIERDPERGVWIGAWSSRSWRIGRVVLFAAATAYAHWRCDLHWLFTLVWTALVLLVRQILVTGRALREGEVLASDEGPEAEGRIARWRWRWRRFVAILPKIGRRRERVPALRGVDLDVGDGMFGLLGPNGAGKTTLLRIVAGVLEPSRGLVEVEGLQVVEDRDLLQGRAGYLPQDSGLYDHMTAREYLDYHALLMGIEDKKRRDRIVQEGLEAVGLDERAEEKVGGFSGGMRQRVGIARTLLDLPDLLVVDEPTVGLDPAERIRFRTLLARLARDRTVLFSTHVVEDVATACDRLAVMDRGRVRFHGTPEELRRRAEGSVWEVRTDEAGAAQLRRTVRVVHVQREAEGEESWMRVRLLAEERPVPKAQPVEPTLEDAYLLLVPARGTEQGGASHG